jgi:hypothetical protein
MFKALLFYTPKQQCMEIQTQNTQTQHTGGTTSGAGVLQNARFELPFAHFRFGV